MKVLSTDLKTLSSSKNGKKIKFQKSHTIYDIEYTPTAKIKQIVEITKVSACFECELVFNIMFRFIPLYHMAIDNISSISETDIVWHKLSASTYARQPLFPQNLNPTKYICFLFIVLIVSCARSYIITYTLLN